MAEPAAEYTPGEMEVVEQKSTYRAFNGLVKWGSLTLAAALLFFVMWLCAGAGLVPSGMVTLILIVIGVAALRSRGGGAAH